jgi:fimbrial isopeptide formation D2 family protein/uncharacterized repeat protein (TIGR01451 family)
MFSLRKKSPILLGWFFCFLFLYGITQIPSQEVYAACGADLQTTLVSSSWPSRVVVWKEFTFAIDVTNIWPTWFWPFVDIILPWWTDWDDGIDFISSKIQSLTIPHSRVQVTWSNLVEHSSFLDSSWAPIEIALSTWEELITLPLPFWSFVQNQTTRITITAILDEFADVNDLLSIQVRWWFWLWCDALNNYSTDLPVVNSLWQSNQVDPVVFIIDKYHPDFSLNTNSVHAVIGPYHVQEYVIRVDVWSWQILSWFHITDSLPWNMVYRWNLSVSYSWYEILNEPLQDWMPHADPDNLLDVYFDEVVWTDDSNDIVVRFSYFIADYWVTWMQTILSWITSTTTNTVVWSAEWTPSDHRDMISIVTSSDNHTMINNVMIVKKDTLNFIWWGWYPWGVVEYPIEFDLSDYNTTTGVVIVDELNDWLRFDSSFIPYIEFTSYQWFVTGQLLSGIYYTIDDSDIGNDTNPTTAWKQRMYINISQFVHDALWTGQLQWWSIAPTTWTAVWWKVVLRAVIQDTYTDTYQPWNESVDVGDLLTNTATINWDTVEWWLFVSSGFFTQALTFRIQWSALTKSIYAINGLTWFSEPVQVWPWDTVTYRLQYAMPSSDAEEIRLVDFLPLPIFSLVSFQWFSSGMIGSIPAAWWATYWITDTLHLLTWLYLFPWTGSVTPTFATNTSDNTLSFIYPEFNDPYNRSSLIDILFTVEVTPEPFADNFNITNMVSVDHKMTSAWVSTISEFVQVTLKQPDLYLTKWVLAVDDPSAVLNPAHSVIVDSACPRIWSFVSSDDLSTEPLQSNVSWVSWKSRITYALVVENQWSAQKWAYDIVVKDMIPDWFSIPVTGMNLCIQNWAWTALTYEPVTWLVVVDTDLFWTGIKIVDPWVASGVWALWWFTQTWWTNILIITYDLETTDALHASGVYVNTWVLFWYSSIEWGPNFVWETLVDEALLSLDSPIFTKQLLTTSVAETTGNSVVAGEEAVFTLNIAVPDTTTLSGMMIIDNFSSWLTLMSIDSIAVSWWIVLATWYTSTWIIAGALIGPSSWSFSLDFWSVVNNDTDLWSTEYIVITYTTRVSNQYGWATNSVLTNDADLSWYTQDMLLSLNDTETLIYRIPTLLIDKSWTIANSNSERFASYTILVQNTSLVSAYDVNIIDELDLKWLEFISWSLSVLGVTWTITEQWPDLQIAYPILAPWAFSQVMFQTKIMTGIAYNTGIVNVVTWTRSTLSWSIPEERWYTGSDSLTTTFAFAPTIAKTLLSTDQSITAWTNVAVWETMVFRVEVTVPEETVLSWFTLTDQLDNGLSFVSVNLLQASGTITSTLWTINTWVIVPSLTSSGTLLTLNFGTVYNSETNLTTNEQIILEYTVRVDNAVTNTNWLTKRNRARANWYTSPSTQSNVEQRTSVVVRDPLLSLQKSAPATNTNSDRTITYTLQISNQSASVLTASNVSITDTLPTDMNFISGVQLSWPTPDTLNFGTSTLIEYTSFPLWQTGLFQITARLDSSITLNTSRTNRTTWSRTSLPGVVSGERTTIVSDDASTNFTFALIPNKTLVSSDYNQTPWTQVTVGEQLMYEIALEVPEDTSFSWVIVTDQLDSGLSWNSLDSIIASWTLTSSLWFGSIIPVISGQQIILDFWTVANSDLNTTETEYIRIRYLVNVDNIPENVASTNLDNTVQTVWLGWSQVVWWPTVTIVEPSVIIDKSWPVTNSWLARTVEYTVTISNIWALNVYDVAWSDIFSGTDMTLLNASVVSGTVPTSFTTWSDVNIAFDTLSGWASSTIQITARLNNNVVTPVNRTNTVNSQWTNLLTWWRVYTWSDQLQTSFSTTPTLSHTIIATDQPHTIWTWIGVIWEIVTYQTRVRIPDDAVVHSWLIHELLGTGYSLIPWSVTVLADTWVSCLPTACDSVIAITGSNFFSINFGTISNVDADGGNDQYITLTYNVLILDIPSVSASSQLPTTATLQWSDNPTGISQAVSVTVVEPSLSIDKLWPATNSNSAREVSYTLYLENDGTVDAYNVSGFDDLWSIWMDLLSAVHTSWPAPTITSLWNTFTYELASLAVWETTTIAVRARLQDSIPTAYIATNTAELSWTSLSAGWWRISTWQDSVATSFNTIGTISKEVIATSESSTIAWDIAFGEIVTYRVSFDLPADATYNTVAFEDILGTWLSYVASSSTISVSWSIVCDPSCASVDPVINWSEMSYIYSSISNTATGAWMTWTVTIEYQAVLNNALTLVDGSTTANSIVLKHSDIPGWTSPVSVAFSVVEPDIELLVSWPAMNTSGARTVTYTVQVTNNGDAPAYSLNFSDILAWVWFDFIDASYVAWVVPSGLWSTDPFVLAYNTLLPWQTSEITLTVRLNDSVPTPVTITHTMTGTYASDAWSTRTYVVVDHASTLFTTPYTLSKTINNTSVSSTQTPNGAIWELVTYTFLVSMEADSTLNDVIFTDQLASWMTFINGEVLPDAWISCSPTCATAAFSVSWQTVSVAFDTLANGAWVAQQIAVAMTIRIDDIPTTIQWTTFTNSVSLVTSDNTWWVLASAPSLTIVEPSLRITKDVSNTTWSRTALYQVTVDHLPWSQSDAYDVILEDPLFDLWFTYVSGSFMQLSGIVPSQTVFTSTGVLWSYNSFPLTWSSTIQFAARLDALSDTAYAKTNVLSGQWNSVTSGWRTYIASDDATITLSSPSTLQHLFVDTNQLETINTWVSIGESVTYSVVLTVPDDGALTDAVLTLDLETWFTFIDLVSVDFGPTITSSLWSAWSITYILSGNQVIIDLWTLSNSDSNTLTTEWVTINYNVRVDTILSNSAWDDLSVDAWLSWSDTQINATSPEVEIIEAAMQVSKSAPVTNNDSSRTIMYTVEINHASWTTHDAYDVLFEDDLAGIGMQYVTWSLIVTGSAPVIVSTDPLSLEWSTLWTWESVMFTFEARLHDSVETPVTVSNIGELTRTSLSWNSLFERNGVDYIVSDQADTLFSSQWTQFKELLTTTLVDTIDPYVAIGEEMIYRLAIEVPENGSLNSVFVEDLLPEQVTYIWSEGITASSAITSSRGSFASLSPVYIPGTHTLTRDFWTVTNSDQLSWTVEYLYLAYRVRVRDEVWIVNWSLIQNSASVEWSDGSVSWSSVIWEVVEPALAFTKSAQDTHFDDQHRLHYYLSVEHTSWSSANAYSVTMVDNLAEWLLQTSLIDITVITGTAPTTMNISWTNLIVEYDSLALGSGSVLEVITTLDNALTWNQLIDNTLTWTRQSLPDSLWWWRSSLSDDSVAYSEQVSESVSLDFIDLSLSSTLQPTSSLDEPITYTVTLSNTWMTTAHNIEVLSLMPVMSWLQIISSAATVWTYNEMTGIWSVGSLPAWDSVVLTIIVTSWTPLVYYLTSEIIGADEPDHDSFPNNQNSDEDDLVSKTITFKNNWQQSSVSGGWWWGGWWGWDDVIVSDPTTSFDELINIPVNINTTPEKPWEENIVTISVYDENREKQLPDERKICVGSFDTCPYSDWKFNSYLFSDVSEKSLFASWVQSLVEHCVIHGNADSAEGWNEGIFSPFSNVKRWEAMKMIARSLKIPADEIWDHFSTKQFANHWALPYAQSLHVRSILTNELNFDDTISQRDFFIVLVRWLQWWWIISPDKDIERLIPLWKYWKQIQRGDVARLLWVVLQKVDTVIENNQQQVNVCEQPIPSSACRYSDWNFWSYTFADLWEDSDLKESIVTLVSYCIIHGVGDSAQINKQWMYRPNDPLLLGEAYKMIARALWIPEAWNHFTLKQDALHWAHWYEQSLLHKWIISTIWVNLDTPMSYKEFIQLLDIASVSQETVYEFTRWDAAKLLWNYLDTIK